MRISIIGYAGSGKSTLAEAISQKLSIPHIHLDRFWFEAGGLDVYNGPSDAERERVRAYVRAETLKAIEVESWVSDGFYSRIQPEIAGRADEVIFLDIPLWRRLLNHLERILKPSTRHKELGIKDELIFFFEIIRRSRAFKPKYENFFKEYKGRLVTLHSRKEMNKYLESLTTQKLIIIGTLHIGLTPKEELKKVLEDINPDKLLVELSAPTKSGSKEEMIFAAEWAEANGIPVGYFDIPFAAFKEAVTPEDPAYKEALAKQAEELKAYSWKELNKKDIYEKCLTTQMMIETFIDKEKWDSRRQQMLSNIKNLALPEGKTLVLTGTAHLNFFEKKLPEVEMPFRKYE